MSTLHRCAEDFEELGRIFFDSLLDYCDPEQAKVDLITSKLRSEALRRAHERHGTNVTLMDALADSDDSESDSDAGSDRYTCCAEA